MNRSLFKATSHDLERLSDEERQIYQELLDVLLANGMPHIEAEDAAYLSFFTK